jgi:hypothetical protein
VFLTRVILADDPVPGMWVVYAPLVWDDAVFGRVTVPTGFRTDLASTPHFMRCSQEFDPTGVSRRAAAVHDFAYARGLGWSKDQCDLFLRAALLAEGATPELAEMYYQGVRLFGQAAWDADAGAIATRDFDTPQHFAEWLATVDSTVAAGNASG